MTMPPFGVNPTPGPWSPKFLIRRSWTNRPWTWQYPHTQLPVNVSPLIPARKPPCPDNAPIREPPNPASDERYIPSGWASTETCPLPIGQVTRVIVRVPLYPDTETVLR